MGKSIELVRSMGHIAALVYNDGEPVDVVVNSIRIRNYETTEGFYKFFKPKVWEYLKDFNTLIISKDSVSLYLIDKLFNDYDNRFASIFENEEKYIVTIHESAVKNIFKRDVILVPDFLEYIRQSFK